VSVVLAVALAAGPVPVVRLESFKFKDWEIACDGLRYTPTCTANHPYRGDCLHMYFYRNEAYVELIPGCDGSRTGNHRSLSLPLNSWDNTVSEAIAVLLRSSSKPNAQLSKQFLDDAETVGALLNKITNEAAP